jgi:PKHD-type hydroxylase
LASDLMFLRVPKLLSEPQLATIGAALQSDSAPWVDGRVTAGHQGALVKSNQQLDDASTTARELGDLVVAQLERTALFISAVLPYRVYPPMFNRYGEGMHFGNHVDGAIRQNPRTGQKLRTDLSATIFLAPPESYDGGDLIIENDFGAREAKFAAGDMVVYTSTSRHRVNPVTRGLRVACVFWIQSLIRGELEREQLLELDHTIQQLTRCGADPDSLVRLSGHYHSLLRLWSET